MKRSLLLLIACAAALPASAIAAEATNAPADLPAAPTAAKLKLGKKGKTVRDWSLKPSGKQQTATVMGPAVPAPQKQAIPKKSTRRAATATGGGIKPVDATPLVRQAIQKNRQGN
jgi:hypothetical protein